jgi:hypothetical protein
VVQIQNARGADGSAVVVSARNLADNEFWNFIAADGSGAYPTSGFVSVSSADGLWNEICANPVAEYAYSGNQTLVNPPNAPCASFKAGWGSVIVLASPTDCGNVAGPAPGQKQDIGGCIDLSMYPPVFLPPGITLRGNRRGANFGPQLYFSDAVLGDTRMRGVAESRRACWRFTETMFESRDSGCAERIALLTDQLRQPWRSAWAGQAQCREVHILPWRPLLNL